MKNIYDIQGFYCSYGAMFNQSDSWLGKIILNPDKTFEGVVKENTGNSLEFVFGKIADNNKLDLIKTTKGDSRLPYHFLTENTETSYRGNYFVKAEDNEFPLGEAKINLMAADKTREITSTEETRLDAEILLAKIALGPISQEIYEEYQLSKNKVKEKSI